ncbi:bifunctional folylpolyglutamate synthase/dihydrofolate synthase [Bacillus sp. FSL K6-3431]|uniref:bifunctional folylpolyglutamate synthase/dihydrofolate synthase n=1 Tax=Bacillus sp. FSL K6-3431 TaxID=2921500 RepID=UPI0030F72C30
MEYMLEKLDHPENKLNAVHVGGTNGKGSTVAYLRSVLMEAGYEVGTFTSPYIEQFNERISLNGKPISDNEITHLVNVIKPLADELEETEFGPPTEFEIITAMSIYYFAVMNPVDFSIMEVGLGGRYDSTNVIEPLVSVITNVGLDHTQILGSTLKQIAYEKAGIIKRNTPVFTAVKDVNALHVLQAEATEQQAELFQINKDFFVKDIISTEHAENFTFTSGSTTMENLEINLLGHHQTENASGAIATLFWLKDNRKVNLDEAIIRSGLIKAYWPGRMEILHTEPVILIDGAHNPEGLRALSAALDNRYLGKNIKVIFAALKDKDLTEMFSVFNNMNVELHVTQFDFPRAASAEELKAMSGNHVIKAHVEWRALIKEQINSMQSNEVLVITGSLYFISLVRPFLLKKLKNDII